MNRIITMIGPEHTSALAKFDFKNESRKVLTKEEAYKLFKQDIRVGTFIILFSLGAFYILEILSLIWLFFGYIGLVFVGQAAIIQIKYNLIPNRFGFIFLVFIGFVLILPNTDNLLYFFFIFFGLIPIFALIGLLILIGPKERKRLKSN
jgi:hypothetical protein